jgi:hypothetical protein
MGVDKFEYVIYGWKLPYKMNDQEGNAIDFWDDKFLPYIEGHQGVDHTLISDGMSGKYRAFGLLLADGDEHEGMDFIEIDFEELNADDVKAVFRDVFGFDPPSEPKVLAFSHFS